MGCHAIYAFVSFVASAPTTVRFASAAAVAVLADADELAYPRKNRYHLTIDQLDVVADFGQLLLGSPR